MSVTITLTPTLRVQRVPRNWNLDRLVTRKPEGKPEYDEWVTIGHHGSIESALKAAAVRQCDEAESLTDALDRMAAIGRRLDRLFAKQAASR